MISLEHLNEQLAASAEDVCLRYLPTGKRKGAYWFAGDAYGSPGQSLKVCLSGPRAGCWNDYATAERGDLLDLIGLSCGLSSFPETLAEAHGFLGIRFDRGGRVPGDRRSCFKAPFSSPARATVITEVAQKYRAILPVPSRHRDEYQGLTHYELGVPVRHWEYLSAKGELMFVIARFETTDGKEIRPMSYGCNNGRPRWNWRRPHVMVPWNLPGLCDENRAHLPVLVVEGEKTAEAIVRLDGYVVTCAHGGAHAARCTHWDHLSKRAVVILPDDDSASMKWAEELTKILHDARVRSVRVLDPSSVYGRTA